MSDECILSDKCSAPTRNTLHQFAAINQWHTNAIGIGAFVYSIYPHMAEETISTLMKVMFCRNCNKRAVSVMVMAVVMMLELPEF